MIFLSRIFLSANPVLFPLAPVGFDGGYRESLAPSKACQTLTVALSHPVWKSLRPPESTADVSQPAKSWLGFWKTETIVTKASIVRG